MKVIKLLTLLSLSVLVFSCSDDDELDPTPPPTPGETILTGEITANKTLTANATWTLKGYVYVDSGVTLTIEPGTVINSDVVEKGALIIESTAKIIANGTAAKPIVFTSGKAAGQRLPGDWGGIVVLGSATTNRTTTPTIEGGVGRPYGGTNDADNSGVIKYVRIEYAGIAAQPGSEINALTLGGVGSGTVIEYVETAYANDDAFEFFGGTVNAKYLVAAYTADDDFDFDFGYRGKIQYAMSLRDPNFADTDDANGIECDNDATGTAAAPFTRPVLSNFTFIGSNAVSTLKHNFANRFRRATRFVVRNSILMGYPKGGFSIEADATATGYKNDESVFRDNLVHALADAYKSNSTVFTAAEMKTKAESQGSTTYTDPNAIQLESPFSLTAPNPLPKAGSPALTGATYNADLDAFFTQGTFRGAFGATNWLTGWTRFFANGQ